MEFKEKRERFNAKHPELARKYIGKARHAYHLKYTHGMSRSDYDALLRIQKKRCAICSRTAAQAGVVHLAVDHCHETGRVRGLLCTVCNFTVGRVCEDPEKASRERGPNRDALIAYIVTRCVVGKRAGAIV